MELSLLIWRTKGLAPIPYFIVLQMPSQSVAPLKAFGFRVCPSSSVDFLNNARIMSAFDSGSNRQYDNAATELPQLRRAFGGKKLESRRHALTSV